MLHALPNHHHTSSPATSVREKLLSPLEEFLHQKSTYRCTTLSDYTWIETGIMRALGNDHSGCGFLQKLTLLAQTSIEKSHYFETLKSKRRLTYITDLTNAFNHHHAQQALRSNPTANLHKNLAEYHIHAGDGHFHAASTHDPKIPNSHHHIPTKYPIGHLYTINLRTHHLTHLALSSKDSNKKPHDMGVLKKLDIQTLRQSATKGQKILYIWDRAGIDFQQWDTWKWQNAIYFLSRTKENMKLQHPLANEFDPDDPINAGILKDEMVSHHQGSMIRRITILLPDNGKEMEYLTNLPITIPPGVIAQLYFMRWQIEKTFDEIKNKMHELKAWAKSSNAKTMQAKFITLAHNLAALMHQNFEDDGTIQQENEKKRHQVRLQQLEQLSQQHHTSISSLRKKLSIPLQKSVKFYRWLRYQLEHIVSWQEAMTQLRHIYSHF